MAGQALALAAAAAASGSSVREAEPSPSALAEEEAAAGKTLSNVTPFRGDVGDDVAERQEGVRRADVPSDKGVGEDGRGVPGGADVVVVVKKRKKSKKGKGSGRKEGEKRKTAKAENPSPEPEEQGRPSVCRQRPRPSLRFVRGHVCICTCRSHARTRSFMHSLARSVCVFFAPLLSSPVSLAVSVLLTLRQTVFFLCVCKTAQCVAFVCTSGPPRRRPVPSFRPTPFIAKLLVMSRSAGQPQKTRFPLVVFASGAVSFLRTESEPCHPLPILPAAIFVIGTPHQVASAAAAAAVP